MVLKLTRAALGAAALVLSSTAAIAQQPRAENPRPLLFGFALECIGCQPGGRARGGAGGKATGADAGARSAPEQYPHVIAVAPGSAAERAGIRPGDELHSIDGHSVLSAEGSARLAGAAAGEEVQLGFERNAKPVSFSLVLGSPLAPSGNGPREMVNDGFMSIAGTVHGDLHLDVWSDQKIYLIPDSTSARGGTITLQIGTTVIRMKFVKDSTDRANRESSSKSPPASF